MTTVEQCKQLVNAELEKLLPETPGKPFENAMREQVLSGGKRIRPVMCMLACEALGGTVQDAIPVATAVEMAQAFSLIHDDIMDCDDLRHGRPSAWKQYGDSLAIDIGDGVFAKSLEALANYAGVRKPDVYRTFSKGVMDMCQGQALDILYEKHGEITLDEYCAMSELKTGAPIAMSLKLGALAAGAGKNVQDTLHSAGMRMGLSYQIWNDCLDLASGRSDKPYASDIRKNKKTVLVCHAIRNLQANEKDDLLSILKTSPENKNQIIIQRAVQLIQKAGSLEFAKKYAADVMGDARSHLKILPECQAKSEILRIADFLISEKV